MPAPIRVAQIMGKMVGGGLEAVVVNYYNQIDHDRVQFDFIVDSDSTLVPRQEIESQGARIFEVPPYQQVAANQKALLKLFQQEQWKIVHSHMNSLSVFPLHAAYKAGVPVRIAHSHSTSGKGESAKNAIKAILKTQSKRYPTHRLACGQYAGEWLFGKGAQFDVLYNAIDLQKFSFDAQARAEVRADLGLADNQFVVGHLGRFVSQKNHVFLLQIFEKLLELRPQSTLVLAGDGELRPLAERWVTEHGLTERVMFLGQRDDAARLYQAFDVFVLPSLYEGLCVVGVEAQASGLPCLLSSAITQEADMTDTVQFLDIDNPALWARELAKLEPKQNRSIKREQFADYDIDAAARKLTVYYEKLYRTL